MALLAINLIPKIILNFLTYSISGGIPFIHRLFLGTGLGHPLLSLF